MIDILSVFRRQKHSAVEPAADDRDRSARPTSRGYPAGSIGKLTMDWFAAMNLGNNISSVIVDFKILMLTRERQANNALDSDPNTKAAIDDLKKAILARASGNGSSQDLLLKNVALRDAAIAYMKLASDFLIEHGYASANEVASAALKRLQLPVEQQTEILPPFMPVRFNSELKLG